MNVGGGSLLRSASGRLTLRVLMLVGVGWLCRCCSLGADFPRKGGPGSGSFQPLRGLAASGAHEKAGRENGSLLQGKAQRDPGRGVVRVYGEIVTRLRWNTKTRDEGHGALAVVVAERRIWYGGFIWIRFTGLYRFCYMSVWKAATKLRVLCCLVGGGADAVTHCFVKPRCTSRQRRIS